MSDGPGREADVKRRAAGRGPGRRDSAAVDPPEAAGDVSADRGFLGRWVDRITDPPVLFPVLAVLLLGAVWVGTLDLIQVERENARSAARATSRELLDTYEAQAVRVLREIDQTLRGIQYVYRLQGDADAVLASLEQRGLLLPPLVYTLSLAGPGGEVAAGTGSNVGADVADREFFRRSRGTDALVVARPAMAPDGDWRLRFSRRLAAPDGSFGGVAVIGVDASFFVSGYEPSKLGEDGVLAVLGTDGVFRARRTGGRVSAGDDVAYDSVAGASEIGDTRVVLGANPWDDVRRYTAARKLYGFPLAVVVGLSEEEALAGAAERARTYRLRAAGGSLLILLVLGVLGRTKWKLDQARRREAEAEVAHARRVEHLAYHDDLTGLPNRALLGRLLERSVSLARRHERTLAVFFLDLDRFKEINDSLGHEAGDQLLREVAERLESTLRESDTVARMGGDEFVVVLPELDAAEEAETVARKILQAMREPVDLLGQRFHVTASIGVSVYPRDGDDVETLMKHADIAMYEAKEDGRNAFRFFSKEMRSSSRAKLALESSLRYALVNGEFELVYQARRNVGTGRVTGMEALLRWEHPELGTVEPMKFIPLAEETGLIVPIGRWVLKTACRQNVAWQDQDLPRLAMAVNLSARQFFDEKLVADVAAALEDSGMDPELLELEICESVLARDADRTAAVLASLKELGVGITIDNFGTGYSSLSVLRRFPLDSVKVDRTFIRDTGSDRVEQDVTDAIVAMGRALSSSLVAQGVETEEQADYLRDHACDEVQGFYFNRPVPAEEFADVLRGDALEVAATGGDPGVGG